MPWVRIDEEFPHHPKVAPVGPFGIAVQVAALCYSNRYLTDGFIPYSAVRTLLDFNRLGENIGDKVELWVELGGMVIAQRLVEAGMWEEVDGGFLIHDFHHYQPSRAQVETERKKTKERVAKYRENKRKARNAHGNAVTNAGGNRGGNRGGSSRKTPPPTTPEGAPDTVAATTPLSPPTELGQSTSKPSGNSLRNAVTNGSETPAPVPVPPVSTTGRTIAITEGGTTGVEQARPIDNVVLVFQTWQASTGKQRAKLDGNRRHAIQAALDRYAIEDVLAAVQGWANDPWAERLQHNDIVQLLWMGTRRKPQNVLEKMRDLWRDGPPIQVGKQTTKAIQISQQMHAMREEVMGGGLGSVERDRGRTQRQLPASRD